MEGTYLVLTGVFQVDWLKVTFQGKIVAVVRLGIMSWFGWLTWALKDETPSSFFFFFTCINNYFIIITIILLGSWVALYFCVCIMNF